MASEKNASPSDQSELLNQILTAVEATQSDCNHLKAAIKGLKGQVNILAGIKEIREAGEQQFVQDNDNTSVSTNLRLQDSHLDAQPTSQDSDLIARAGIENQSHAAIAIETSPLGRKTDAVMTSKIILTTYPGQSGIDPLTMHWGHKDALQRGPVVVSRNQSTIRRRNGRLRWNSVCSFL